MGSNHIAEALGIPSDPSGMHTNDPYPLEVPIRVRGLAGVGNLGADAEFEPFLEDTQTVLVSPRGAVLRLAAQASPGQMLTVSSPRLGCELPARVIRYRGHADVKGYAEIEFAPDAAIPGSAAAAHLATSEPRGHCCAPTLVGAPIAVTHLTDLLEEKPQSIPTPRNYEPVVAVPVKRPASPPRPQSKRGPRAKAASPANATVAMDLEALLAARKVAEQPSVHAQPVPREFAPRLLETGELTSFAEPRRPRKRLLAIAAAVLLTLGAAGAWAVVGTVPVMSELPKIAAFALPEPPAEIVLHNAALVLPTLRVETESPPIATTLIAPTRKPSAQSLRSMMIAQTPQSLVKQRAAEATPAPEIVPPESVPAGAAQSLFGAPKPAASPAPPLPAKPVIGGDVTPPRLVSQAPVVFPQIARLTRAEGDVVVDARVDENGRVTETRIVSGPAVFHQAAKDSLARWRYQPAMLNGQPVASHVYVTLQFRR